MFRDKEGHEVICILHLKIKNSGGDSSVLKTITVRLDKIKQFHPPDKPDTFSEPDRCTECHDVIPSQVDVNKLIKNREYTINSGYEVPPHKGGDTYLKLSGESLYAKVFVSVLTDEDITLPYDDPVPVLIVDHSTKGKSVFDDIKIIPGLLVEILDEEELDEMSRSGYIGFPVLDDKKTEQKR